MFDFEEMLEEYSQPIVIVTQSDGYWSAVTGQWVDGDMTEVEISAPVLPVTPDNLRHDSLSYDINDRKLYLHSHLENNQKIKIDVVNATATLTNGGRTFTVSTSLTGVAGNGVKIVFADTGSAGFAASYSATTKIITLNFGGDVSVTCDQIEYAIDDLTLFTASTTTPAGVFTLADIARQATFSGGYEIEYTVMGRRDYSVHAQGLRIYTIRRSDAGD